MSSHFSGVSRDSFDASSHPLSPSPSFFSKLIMRRKKMRAQAVPLHAQLSLTQLPPELLFYLARSYLGKRDILRLCTTSSMLYSLLFPTLYSDIEAKTVEKCKHRIDLLLGQPHVAHHIQRLTLRPSHSSTPSPQALQAEASLTKALELLAPNLVSLHTFIWDGHEMPEDSIWATLRACCPRLRYVGSSIGTRPIPVDSELFQFESLLGFTLTTKRQRPAWMDDGSWNLLGQLPFEELPDSLWEMLHRSNNLEELELGGQGISLFTRLLDVRPLTLGRWPKLRTLKLGHTLLREGPEREQTSLNPFELFVSTHPNLKELSLPYPTRIQKLHTLAPGVTIQSFSGSLPYLRSLLPFCDLTTLSLCTEEHPAWYIPYVRQTLKTCLSLTTLSLWIDLSHRDVLPAESKDDPEMRETDHIKIFQSILTSCPTLLHFKLLCSTRRKFGFQMHDFSRALEGGPNLKTLEVQKVLRFIEEDMPQSALHLARQCPSLEQITLRYGFDSWSDVRPFELMQAGIYDLTADDSGNLIRLDADEVRTGFSGKYGRRYQRDLRPLRDQLAQKFVHNVNRR